MRSARIFSLFLLVMVFAACSGEEALTGPGASDACLLTGFSIVTPAEVGVINTNDNTVQVSLVAGSSVSNLVPNITVSAGATVSPGTGEVQDFSSPVVYTVTAADGTTAAQYTVTVTVSAADAKSIDDFKFLTVPVSTGVINQSTGAISVAIPYGTNLSALVATFAKQGTNVYVDGAVQISGTTVNDFSSPVNYTVYAADGSSKSYTVTATNKSVGVACDIATFSINGVLGTVSGTNISVTVPNGTDLSSLSPVLTLSEGATVSPASGAAQDFSGGVVTYTVTAQDGTTTQAYAVTVVAAAVEVWHTETFENATATGSTYTTGTSDSNDAGITWSFQGRTDNDAQIDSGNTALMIGKTGGFLEATLPSGCGKVKFRFQQAYSDYEPIEVYANSTLIHTTATATTTAQDSGEIAVNVSGSCILRIVAKTDGERVKIDDLSWTDGTPPETDPPTVSITSPTASATVTAYQLSVGGTADDAGTDASGVAEVWAKLDSGSYVKISGTTSWSHTFNTVSEGSHTVSVYSKDAAGNSSAISTVTVTVAHPVDTTNPGVVISSPSEGASITGAVAVSGTSSDDLSGVKAVYARVDSGSFEQVTGTTSWSHSFSSLTTGSHTISVYSEDNAGNVSATNTISITVAIPKWTVMVYLVADNDLEGAGVEDFQEMEDGIYDAVAAGDSDITNNINIIVMFDRSPSHDSSDGNWSDTRLFRILPDSNMTTSASDRLDDGVLTASHHIANLGEKQMDDPATLSWFLNYCKTEFPAENYGLILWNHGGGTRSAKTKTSKTTRPLKEVCWDDTSGSWEPLYLDEVQQAVKAHFNASDKLGFIGYDACLMGMVETAYEFRNLAKYMVASMQSEQGDGWDYEYIFKNMGDGSSLDAEGFAKLLVEQYRYFIGLTGSDGETLAAADLTQMESLKTAIDALAVAINAEGKKTAIEGVRDASVNYVSGYPEYYPFYDLWDFCNNLYTDSANSFSTDLKTAANNVIAAMQNTIVSCFGQSGNGQSSYYNSDADAKRGLSIFFSNSSTDWANQGWYTTDDNSADAWDSTTIYGNIDFCTTGSGVSTWRDLMDTWY